MNTNENPYPPSPRALAALRAGVTEDLRLYPDPTADLLREKAAAVYGCSKEQVLAGNGSDDILSMIVAACVDQGARVVYPYPTYSLYDTLVKIGGGEIVHVPFGRRDFSLPADELIAARGRVTFLCNPNSPSGTAYPVSLCGEIADRVSGLLVVDEAYVDFSDESALPLALEKENVIVLRSFSKSFSLAGLRVGLAFSSAEIVAEMMKVKDSYNLDRLGILGATAALDDLKWMQGNVRRIRETRARMVGALSDLGFEVLPSGANFIFVRKPGNDLRGVHEALRERGILVRYFDLPELRDGIRITVGTDAEVDTLLAVLKELPGEE